MDMLWGKESIVLDGHTMLCYRQNMSDSIPNNTTQSSSALAGLSSTSYSTTAGVGPIELKGRVSNLTVVRLNSTSVAEISEELRKKTAQLPHFFQHVPIVFDVKPLAEDQIAAVDFDALVQALKDMKLVPVAVGNMPAAYHESATKAGLGILKDGLGRPRKLPSNNSQAGNASADISPGSDISTGTTTSSDASLTPLPSNNVADNAQNEDIEDEQSDSYELGKVFLTPVRSGQVVYAQQRDLIVLSSINAGAEVIADGNVHCYGPLRGRALAGAHGNQKAQIFCYSLEAELLSIAGNYLRAEEIPPEYVGKPVHIFWDEASEKLSIRKLDVSKSMRHLGSQLPNDVQSGRKRQAGVGVV